MSVLCVIVDCNACAWAAMLEQSKASDLVALSISSIVSFCNAHRAQNLFNRLVIFAAGAHVPSQPLYSDLQPATDARREMSQGLRKALNQSAKSTSESSSVPLAATVALSLCQSPSRTVDARILVIGVSEDISGDHKRLMNLFFTAHKQDVLVDVLALGPRRLPLLQQAADITGGIHLTVEGAQLLLHNLLTFFLCDPRTRPLLALPEPEGVDYRTTCFCHADAVSVAFACSVCLAVHCKMTPICDACGSVFKIDFTRISRKRKKNAN